ncbi:MAG: amidohydrolase, partial [Vicinamibacteria bacterium]
MRVSRSSWVLVAYLLPAGCVTAPPPEEPADLVLRNGKIVTADDARPESSALAVRGTEIVAVGSDEEIDRYVG